MTLPRWLEVRFNINWIARHKLSPVQALRHVHERHVHERQVHTSAMGRQHEEWEIGPRTYPYYPLIITIERGLWNCGNWNG